MSAGEAFDGAFWVAEDDIVPSIVLGMIALAGLRCRRRC